MFRRSRFSIRPNVGAAGRTAATSQDPSETPKDVSEAGTVTAVTDNKSVVNQAASGDGNDQNVEGTNSPAAVQRRKRFSIKPKVAPGRPSMVPRTPKSPAKAVSATPVEVPVPDLDQQTVYPSSQTEIQCPVPKVQPELIPSESSGLSAAPLAEDSPELTDPPADSCKQLETTADSPVKVVPSKLPDKVPPSLPSKEAIEISEKAKTLVASKGQFSLSPSALSLSRLLNDPSDLQRLAKARKLRELLRQERCKEKKIKRSKLPQKEFTLDPSKMTMRDLIHYLPGSNPMKSSLEDPASENETIVPPSPGREASPERVQESADPPRVASPTEEEEGEAAEEDDALMVPQVKVAEDGSLIIDEESLTVEVQRAKGPNPAQERDPIFERGSTTTYSSFRKGTSTKPWSSEETDMFFLAISMVGTDFSMICQLFPHRPRSEIKNKFKKEERANSWRIDKAFRERRKLDIEYFAKLLEKVLEVQKNRKKLKSIAEKNSSKKSRAKGKKAEKKQSGEEAADLEKEGEKENEDLCNEGGSPDSKPKKKRKRKQNASKEEPTDKKNKKGEKSKKQDEACIPEDAEAAPPEDHTNSDMAEKSENAAKESAIKPAKLSRGRAPKPLLPLGRKWGKKSQPASTKAKDTAPDKGDESDEASDEQVNKDASPANQGIKRKLPNDDVSSENEDATVQRLRPTRSGKVPKPVKPLNYLSEDDASEATPSLPAGSTASAAKPKPKCKAKGGQSSKSQSAQEPKKSKLVTLRASQAGYSDEGSENQSVDGDLEEEEEEHPACSSSKDSIAPAFVPASLRSPQTVISEVEETMVELDMLANIPDVLGISQDALCPDVSCEMAQNETGTSETCEHQLDLLVDVIDFLSSDVCQDESYNEAAQTLLTIGNLAHLSQSAQNQTVLQDHLSGMETVDGDETSQHLEVVIASNPAAQEENSATLLSVTFGEGVADTSEPDTTVELQNNTTGMPVIDQRIDSDVDSVAVPQLQPSPEKSKQNSSQTRTGRLSKVKPKPNLRQASRTAQSRSQTETASTEESHTVASDPPQTTETAAGETSKTANLSQGIIKGEISCVEIKHTEEPSGSLEKPDRQGVTDAVELQTSTAENSDILPIETSDGGTGSDLDPTPQLESSPDRSKRNPPQTRTGRLSRVKPKPNLGQASRTAPSRSRTETSSTKESHRADPDFSQPTETAAKETPKGADRKDEISCIELTEEPPGSQEMSIGHAKSGAAASDQTVSNTQSQSSCNTTFEPSLEQATTDSTRESTDEILASHVGTTESNCSNQETSELQETNMDLGPIPQSVDHPAPCLTPVEDLRAGQKEGNEDASACPARRSRFQRVKPKPNVASTSRTKPKTTKNTTEKDADPTPNPKFDERTIELEAESASITSPAKPDQSTDLSSVLMPSLDQGSTLTPTEELSEKKADVGQVESSGTTSDLIIAEMKSFPEAQFEPRPTSESAEENMDTEPVPEGSDPLVGQVKELPVSQKKELEDASTPPARRSRFPKVKPILPQTSRTVRSKPQTTKDPVAPMEPVVKSTEDTIAEVEAEPTCSTTPPGKPSQVKNSSTASESVPSLELYLDQKPTEELSSTDDQKTDGRSALDSSSEVSEQNLTQRRRRISKVKPNFGASIRTTRAKAENPAGERESTREAGPVSQSDCKQDMSSRATETNTQLTDDPTATSVQSSEGGSRESQIKSVLPTNTQSTVTPDSQGSTEQPQSQDATQRCPETSESNQSTDENESAQSSRKAPTTRRGRLIKPKPNLKRSSQPLHVQNTKQADADSGAPSESVDASVSHKPASEPRPDFQDPTGGAIEQHSNQNYPPDDAECSVGSLTQVIEQLNQLDSASNVVGSSVDCLTQESDNSAKDASTSSTGEIQGHPSLAIFADMLPEQVPSDLDEPFFILSLTEIPVCSSGEVLDSASEHLPHLTVTEESIQQPSVPGLAAAGDVVLSNVPVSMEGSFEADLVSVKDVGPEAAAQLGSIMEVPVDPHESTTVQPSELPQTEEINDEAEHFPAKPRLRGSRRTAAKLQVEPTTQRKTRASKNLSAKEAESTPPTQDSELPGPSVQPRVFDEVAKPQKGSSEHEDTQKEALMGGDDPEDSRSGAQTTSTRGASRQNRKAEDFPSFLSETHNSDSPPAKAASSSRTVKTRARAAGKRSAPAATASTSEGVAAAPSQTPAPEQTRSTPSTTAPMDVEEMSEFRLCSTPKTSLCTAEVSASQRRDYSCVEEEEEPTSVSQYFLSDIFTDVEEG